jgi:putative addiction module component (TIGR02574 family)
MTIQIQELSNAERILLAEELWDSVANDDQLFPLTEEQKDLLNLRLAKYIQDKESGSSWREVKIRITGE